MLNVIFLDIIMKCASDSDDTIKRKFLVALLINLWKKTQEDVIFYVEMQTIFSTAIWQILIVCCIIKFWSTQRQFIVEYLKTPSRASFKVTGGPGSEGHTWHMS